MEETPTKSRQRRPKDIEDVVGFAVSHRIRVQVLTILAEGVFSPEEIARIIGEPTNKVSHHIKELVERGSIELVETRPIRNANQHFYRAIEMPCYTDEEFAAMTWQQRQVTAGLSIQTMIAEMLDALRAGNLHSDPRVWLTTRWFNVDEEGRHEIADLLQRTWDRCHEIEAKAINRAVETDVPTESIMVQMLGFKRSRSGPNRPSSANAE